MKKKLKNLIERIVDNSKPKVVDKISYGIIVLTSMATLYLFISTLDIIKTPIIQVHSIVLYTILVLLVGGLFFFTMLGEKTNKPVNRPKIYLFTAITLAILTYSLLAEIFNYTFTVFIDGLLEVAEVPSFLIHTNVRLLTVFLPILIVILVFNKSISIPFNKVYRSELLEYQVDILTRNVYKITENTVDVKICEDVESGKDVIVSEQIAFRHKLIDGSSGSGKTALSIRPDLAQLFYKKAKFREKLKELTYEALEKGLCTINKPVTNKYMNDNFSMDLITIKEDRKEEFLNLFKNCIVGVRNSDKQLFSKNVKFDSDKQPLHLEIPIIIHSDIKKIIVNFKVYEKYMIQEEIPIEFKNEVNKKIERKGYNIQVIKKPYTEIVGDPNGEEEIRFIEKEFGENEEKKLYSEYLDVTITSNNNDYKDYSFDITIDEKGDGKIIYSNLGVTVIAPDGGLSKDTVEIAESNGVHVHKIDPKMEEIRKGNIARFNPLLVGSPEKAGDIVSSILVAMEQSSGGKDSNPYYTNASIRAVRNVIILLKVMYPKLNNGDNPILTDALDMLNNFNLVIPYVKAMKQDKYLSVRWKSVIDYFETSFYPQEYDDNDKPVRDSYVGTKRKKTEEAITGVINQLDNFLGREEIRHIFCDRNDSLNFSEVLEDGECIAVSTRQSELGDVLGKAFALMIILSVQNAVLGRYSEDENPEIPHYLYIDEFPFYVNDQTKVFFTFARKYKTSCNIAIQNLAQLEEVDKIFREVIFTNCTTKIVLPGANVEDREYFCKAFGIKEEFEVMTSITSNPVITENAKYSEAARGSLQEKNKVSEQELGELKFKRCYYTTVDQKGNTVTGKGYMDFLKLTNNNTMESKSFDFEQFINLSLLNDIENNKIDKSINSKVSGSNQFTEISCEEKNIIEEDTEALEIFLGEKFAAVCEFEDEEGNVISEDDIIEDEKVDSINENTEIEDKQDKSEDNRLLDNNGIEEIELINITDDNTSSLSIQSREEDANSSSVNSATKEESLQSNTKISDEGFKAIQKNEINEEEYNFDKINDDFQLDNITVVSVIEQQ